MRWKSGLLNWLKREVHLRMRCGCPPMSCQLRGHKERKNSINRCSNVSPRSHLMRVLLSMSIQTTSRVLRYQSGDMISARIFHTSSASSKMVLNSTSFTTICSSALNFITGPMNGRQICEQPKWPSSTGPPVLQNTTQTFCSKALVAMVLLMKMFSLSGLYSIPLGPQSGSFHKVGITIILAPFLTSSRNASGNARSQQISSPILPNSSVSKTS